MLCKLLTCRSDATERRIVPFGAVNLCGIHASEFDAWTPGGERPHILGELTVACRFGPREDPPLEQSERGPGYAHGYKTGTE